MKPIRLLITVVAALSISGGFAGRAVAAPRHASRYGIVATSRGPVIGTQRAGVREYLGIPYAAPPVGQLRWRPPQLHARWTRPLRATHFGPRCAQSTTLGVFAEPSASEDCLYLNVFAPVHARREPVIVFLHGGGDYDGESNDYDGTKLATGGRDGGHDSIVVTLNYRLGLFGFLAVPSLDTEGHAYADYGILDQQAALRWVRANVGAFGGDPHDVTLAGQSAGAQDVDANVISPGARGLFDRAISESSLTEVLAPIDAALKQGEGFAKAAACPVAGPGGAACLRRLPISKILALEGTASKVGPYTSQLPIVDGHVIPTQPEHAWATGAFAEVPRMAGTLDDEGNFTIATDQYFTRRPVTAASYPAAIDKMFGPPDYAAGTPAEVLAAYPSADYATPQLALDAVITASAIHHGVCENLFAAAQLAKRVPVYDYQFQDRAAPFYFPKLSGFVPLAAHTTDLQFLFPGYHGGVRGVAHRLAPAQRRLSNALVARWTDFAARGNPNRSARGLIWPRFDPGATAPSVLSENVPRLGLISPASLSTRYDCDFWNRISPWATAGR